MNQLANLFSLILFFFNDTATTEIYTLSLHDALPISEVAGHRPTAHSPIECLRCAGPRDRKSTRLNSSHEWISYAVFCLKKKTERRTKLPKSLPSTATDEELANMVSRRSRVQLIESVRSGVVEVGTKSTTFFLFKQTAAAEIYTLSLHDALPI